LGSTDEDFQNLLRQNAELLEAVEIAEGRAKQMKDAGEKNKYMKEWKTLKSPAKKVQPEIVSPKETSAEKQVRQRMERLANLKNGAGLR